MDTLTDLKHRLDFAQRECERVNRQIGFNKKMKQRREETIVRAKTEAKAFKEKIGALKQKLKPLKKR